MAYTASALSFLLENLGKPVILTGSQLPIFVPMSDARLNLVGAALLAGNDICSEVCIFFDATLMRGNRAVKADASGFLAFTTPSYPTLATVGVNIQVNRSLLRPPPTQRFRLATRRRRLGHPVRGSSSRLLADAAAMYPGNSNEGESRFSPTKSAKAAFGRTESCRTCGEPAPLSKSDAASGAISPANLDQQSQPFSPEAVSYTVPSPTKSEGAAQIPDESEHNHLVGHHSATLASAHVSPPKYKYSKPQPMENKDARSKPLSARSSPAAVAPPSRGEPSEPLSAQTIHPPMVPVEEVPGATRRLDSAVGFDALQTAAESLAAKSAASAGHTTPPKPASRALKPEDQPGHSAAASSQVRSATNSNFGYPMHATGSALGDPGGWESFDCLQLTDKIRQLPSLDLRSEQREIEMRCKGAMESRITCLWLVPGFDDGCLRSWTNQKAVILCLYGTGNAPSKKKGLVTAVKSLVDSGVVVAVVSQCHKGRVQLDAYAVGAQMLGAGAVGCFDMTVEATATKLALLLSQHPKDPDKVKRLLVQNMRGELTAG